MVHGRYVVAQVCKIHESVTNRAVGHYDSVPAIYERVAKR